MRHTGSSIVVLVIATASPLAAARAPGGSTKNSSVRAFAPGVRIDWAKGEVEVDAKVVFRSGPLELIACSPRTREHESILAISVRPMLVFQAMGLVGLEPGSPVRYDEKTERFKPATGQRLDINVRFADATGERTIPIRRWLVDVSTDKPPEGIEWVFAGSHTDDKGRFSADLDGTILCVVDFDSALIALAVLHTADNAQLWLRANTPEIPPIGTKCTLLIRAKTTDPIEVTVATDGKIFRANQEITVDEIARSALANPQAAGEPVVVIRGVSGVPHAQIVAVVEAITKAGVKRSLIRIQPSGKRAKSPEESSGESGVEVP